MGLGWLLFHTSVLKSAVGRLRIEDIVQGGTICLVGLRGGMSQINAMFYEKNVQNYKAEGQLPKGTAFG